MELSQLDPPAQVALAQIQVSLSEIAPEIPEREIVPDAQLFADLQLDLVSKWALAVELERITKSELLDREISAAATVGDLIALISGSEVTQKLAREGKTAFSPADDANITDGSTTRKTTDTPPNDLAAADSQLQDGDENRLATAEDLAALFK